MSLEEIAELDMTELELAVELLETEELLEFVLLLETMLELEIDELERASELLETLVELLDATELLEVVELPPAKSVRSLQVVFLLPGSSPYSTPRPLVPTYMRL